ncbi:MAG: 2,3-bisphosphoglycerate-independent phosphoglycerate mutase [Deltaproteobacteria bacterium]|nr:2,3-bisphosphoglycerate-independent phosphoglycerate mutase [Deltaproteobacteria bacterium]
MRPPLTMLIVLDGWGLREPAEDNAASCAHTPFFDRITREHPMCRLDATGEAVGLPKGQMGNSEVGHLTLGAGRIIDMDLRRITKATEDGSLARNPALLDTLRAAREAGGSVHFMGLVSDGGIHSHMKHLIALLRTAVDEKCPRIFVHAFLDGRDTPPSSARGYIAALEEAIAAIRTSHPECTLRIATIMGRYYAMDRDSRWERTGQAYACLVGGEGRRAASADEAIVTAYEKGETDEFVKPVFIDPPPGGAVNDGCIESRDAAVFFNFRADRARQITNALNDQRPDLFEGKLVRKSVPKLSAFACMAAYDELFRLPVLFPTQKPRQVLGEVLSAAGCRQLRIAETEKYAHVTFFFDGGEEKSYEGEDRVLIPSPRDVPTYDHKPEMSAPGVTDEVIRRIESGNYDFILMNYANPDMVGHTGVFPAAVKAAEIIDACLDRVSQAALAAGGVVLITADHGNLEQMRDPETGEPHTAHTKNLVPLHVLDGRAEAASRVRKLRDGGLCDVAPTILAIMEIPKSGEMTGRSLIEKP